MFIVYLYEWKEFVFVSVICVYRIVVRIVFLESLVLRRGGGRLEGGVWG